jgi:hypothetical protein
MTVSNTDLPNDLGRIMDAMDFREPAAELAALSQGDDDPSLQLPMAWIQLYRGKIEEGSAPSISMMLLNRASVVMPRTHLVGILDRVKSTGLDLALSLEDVTREAGVAGGPTVDDDPRIAREVHVHLTQLFAPGSTITVGDHASVASGPGSVAVQLQVGDLDGLLSAASAYLANDAVEELRMALGEDGGQAGTKTRSFLDRVKSGGVTLAAGVTTNGAYAGIVALLQQTFGG